MEHSNHNNIISSWDSIIERIESNIDSKDEFKELFTLIFNSYCSELEKNDNHSEVLKCFETALKLYGQDSNILVELGSFFVKNCILHDITRRCFKDMKKRVSWKQIRHISNQFQAVNDENLLKNSFLYDCGNVDVASIKQVLNVLRQRRLISSDITVVTLSQDILILNVKKILERENSSKFVIDVSGSNDKPMLVPQDKMNSFNVMFEEIRKQLKLNNYDIISDDNWCITSIFGYLINYPVLYYLPNNIDSNCLSHIDLKVFQILLNDDIVISFSIPLDIFNDNEAIQCHIAAYLKTYQNYSNKYQIKSFIANHSHVNL
ncbi:hypothetical protein ACKWTF_005991 [Chironomus riparius]